MNAKCRCGFLGLPRTGPYADQEHKPWCPARPNG